MSCIDDRIPRFFDELNRRTFLATAGRFSFWGLVASATGLGRVATAQTSDAPDSAPSSGSLPEPWKLTDVPCVNVLPLSGAVIETVGGRFGASSMPMPTLVDAELPSESVAVSVIV